MLRGGPLVNGPARGVQRSHLSFWKIWNMSFGFLGIQFGWALPMANTGAIYEYLGADAHQIPILWLPAPLTGPIGQPGGSPTTDRTPNRPGPWRPHSPSARLLPPSPRSSMPSA